jgi:2-keto-4-pentenoate hydratase/2-oxohepta-3-ene-1,7-dioic acid hydratase in catechol pathway
MRLVSYGSRGSEAPGALVNDAILPLSAIFTELGLPSNGGIRSVLPFLDRLAVGIEAALNRGDEMVPAVHTRLGPPVPDPPNLFNCGANYFAHLVEHGMDPDALPTLPVIFQKPASALSGPTDPIERPHECTQLDYEAELAIVIGKGLREWTRISSRTAGGGRCSW